MRRRIWPSPNLSLLSRLLALANSRWGVSLPLIGGDSVNFTCSRAFEQTSPQVGGAIAQRNRDDKRDKEFGWAGEARRQQVPDDVEEHVGLETGVSPCEHDVQELRMAQSLGIHLSSNRLSTEGVGDFSFGLEWN
jgi:hypothetical protein